MSSFLSTLENTYNGESKHYNMKQFIHAAGIYVRTRTEESASFISRHLQLLSVTIDYSVFDPNTSVVCEFFVSLHELLTSLEPRSSLAWCCINVLSVACRNSSARNQLIHTYQFIPAMSRLLGDHLNNDKKVRLLTVMQELSCGLKISWQIPHLAHLMSTLTRWVERESQCEPITMLSLGVLVNLCYKNLPAIYTLSKCVDIKKFVKICSRLKGVKMEVNVCKLLIILDYIHGIVPEEAFLKLIHVTFKSIREAFEAKDAILLRHVVEFYLDVKNQNEKTEVNNHDVIIGKYENYHTEVEQLLNVVDNNATNASGDASQHDPECMSLIFRFLHSLVEMKLPKLVPLYPQFIQLALRWIQTELASSEALSVLRTVSLSSHLEDENIFEPLMSVLPIFAAGLQTVEEDVIMNIDHCKRLCSVMQLLRALVQAESTRERVLATLTEQMICQVFVPLIGSASPRARAGDANNCTPEAVSLYINTLVLVNELARYSSNWVPPLSTLLQHRQIHAVLADALYSSDQETKSLILGMAAYALFPSHHVAVAMYELQPLIKSVGQEYSNIGVQNNMMCYPVMSSSQTEKLDETIHMLKEACAQNHIVNISTSDVMELYEYKLASMGHAERAAMASVEAASQRCTHLQHQTAQLMAEISRIRQLFIHTQQCSEEMNKANRVMEENSRDLTNRLEAEKGRSKVSQTQLATKERMLVEKECQIEDLSKRLKDKEAERTLLEESNTQLRGVIQKLEENLKRQEKNSERKDDIIKKANANIEHFKLQVVQLERQMKQTELELKTRTHELNNISRELSEKSQLIDTITRLTHTNSK